MHAMVLCVSYFLDDYMRLCGVGNAVYFCYSVANLFDLFNL